MLFSNVRKVITFGLVLWVATALAQQSPPNLLQLRFVEAVRVNFDSWDGNHDGQLSDDEVMKAIENREVIGDAAAASAAIRAQYHRKGHELSPLTKAYFDAEDPSLPSLVAGFKSCLSRISGGLKAPLFQADGPTLQGCKQGALGDCFLVAATGAVLARDPHVITNMIQVDPENLEYRVTYPDGFQINVQPYTQGELALGGAGYRDGLWLRVLEKSWADRRIALSGHPDEAKPFVDVIGRGGNTRMVAEAMTGHSFHGYNLGIPKRGERISLDDLRDVVKEAVPAKRIMVTGITSTTVPGLSSRHAYAVLGFDPATDELTVWNPHVNRFTPKGPEGLTNGYLTVKGTFQVRLTEFRDIFNSIAIETDKPKTINGAIKG